MRYIPSGTRPRPHRAVSPYRLRPFSSSVAIQSMSESPKIQQRTLKITLGVLFVLALAMGTGPGLYLVNPDPAGSTLPATVLGMPILFVWAAVWLFVLMAIVLMAYVRLWSREEERA